MAQTPRLSGKSLFVLTGIYLLVGALTVEVGVRCFLYIEWRREMRRDHGLHVPDSIVGYKLNPGVTVWGRKVNSLGYRGQEFSINKPGGVFRIVCSGNSITFGEAATNESTAYPAVLEKVIRERGEIDRPVEVINAGVMGYTSYQCLVDLKTRLYALQPDLMILCTGWNDITFSKYIGWTREMNWGNPWHFFEAEDSYAVWLLNQRSLHIPAGVHPAPLKAFSMNLKEIISLCNWNGIPLAVLDPPTIFSQVMTPTEEEKCKINYFVRGDIPVYAAFVSALKEVAARHAAPIFDSGLTYSVSGKDSIIVDVCHPNDAGYRYMVDRLYPQVKSEILKIMKAQEQSQSGPTRSQGHRVDS
jgi:lysophospholipase L1-like esterase